MYSAFLFFFFKQKTAYEMRISDWSSDVCSSDLRLRERPDEEDQRRDPRIAGQRPAVRVERGDVDLVMMGDVGNLRPALRPAARDDPLAIARRHRFDGTEGGELGFVRSFGQFIFSLASPLIGPLPDPNERGAVGGPDTRRKHHKP